MVWNLMFWFAVAYLGIAIIWRFFVPALLPGPRPGKSHKEAEPPSGAERFFARSKFFPILAVVLLGLPILARTNKDMLKSLFRTRWSADEKKQLSHFAESMDLYDQATEIASTQQVSDEDWESIRALLEASQSEAQQVPDAILSKIDHDLPELYHDKFQAGLRTGIFGLTIHTVGTAKSRPDSLAGQGNDSLRIGRQLLSQWDNWYLPRQTTISEKIGPVKD